MYMQLRSKCLSCPSVWEVKYSFLYVSVLPFGLYGLTHTGVYYVTEKRALQHLKFTKNSSGVSWGIAKITKD